jgi:prepilin signal peptidase PulO-like enzyme (type II secretory pathway)
MIVLVLIWLVMLGLILGSFANALVWRMHAQDEARDEIETLEAQKASKKRNADLKAKREELTKLSMRTGRSMCSSCKHPLAAKDLIPLFSYLWLRGKCRYCHQKIVDPPLMEAGLALAFVLSFIFWPLDMVGYGLVAFIFWLVFLTAFAVLTLYDLRWFLLPDRVVWPLVGLAVAQVALHVFVFGGGSEALWGALWGMAVGCGVFLVLYTVSRGEWIGFGDVKLGIVLGLLVGGLMQGMLLIFLASLFGTLASVPALIRSRGKRNKRQMIIPFGPFLIAAAVVLVLFGQMITDWLTGTLFLPI